MSWPVSRLDEVANVVAGNPAPQGSSDFVKGGYLFIRMQDVGREHRTVNIRMSTDKVSTETVAKYRLRLFPSGSVLIPKSGASVNLNHRAMLGCDAYVVSHLAVVIPNRERLISEYLYYWSLSYDPRNQAQTTSLPSLPLSLIKAAAIPIPPLPEQRRIVDLLSRAEGIVRLRREAEKKAAELIPALFLDVFGDPATNPKGWPEYRLGEMAEVVSGVTKGRKLADKQTVQVPYLRVANVQAGHIDLRVLKTIEALPREVEQLALQRGDVVLTEGGDFDKLGRGALWEHGVANCIHQNHVFRVRLTQSAGMPEFFVTYLQASKARDYFLRCAKRTTNLASINMTQLRALPVVLPSMNVQHAFVEHFNAMRSIQSQQSAATAKAQAAFDALLDRTFARRD